MDIDVAVENNNSERGYGVIVLISNGSMTTWSMMEEKEECKKGYEGMKDEDERLNGITGVYRELAGETDVATCKVKLILPIHWNKPHHQTSPRLSKASCALPHPPSYHGFPDLSFIPLGILTQVFPRVVASDSSICYVACSLVSQGHLEQVLACMHLPRSRNLKRRRGSCRNER